MPTRPVAAVASTIAWMKAPSCCGALPHRARTTRGQHLGADDAGGDGVLEVVADVGDAVGPRHDLALGRGRRRPGPGVVADAVERLDAEVERGEHRRRRPRRVVVPAVDVGRQGVLAGVAARAVAAVVAEGDGLGERDVEAEARATDVATWATSRAWVSRVRWWSSGKTNTCVLPARRRKAVACRMRSRSRSKQVRSGSGSSATARWPAPTARVALGREHGVFRLLAVPDGPARLAPSGGDASRRGRRRSPRRMAGHRGRPPCRPLGRSGVVDHAPTVSERVLTRFGR